MNASTTLLQGYDLAGLSVFPPPSLYLHESWGGPCQRCFLQLYFCSGLRFLLSNHCLAYYLKIIPSVHYRKRDTTRFEGTRARKYGRPDIFLWLSSYSNCSSNCPEPHILPLFLITATIISHYYHSYITLLTTTNIQESVILSNCSGWAVLIYAHCMAMWSFGNVTK